MLQSNKFADYLETVRQQIRWKRAQTYVLEEIENHLADQKDAFQRDGFDEEMATIKAIAEMGDPVVVGEQLDRTHRPKPDWPLLAMTAMLIILGLTLQFIVGTDINNGMEMFYRQVTWAGLAVIVFLVAYFLDFTIVGKYSLIIYLLLIAITLGDYWFFGVRAAGYNTVIYPFLLFPTIFAGLVYRMRNEGYWGLAFCGASVIVPVFLILLIHNSTVLFLIGTSCLIILTVAIAKGWFNVRKLYALLMLYLSSAVIFLTMFFMMINQDYVRIRLQLALNPSSDPMGVGYMPTLIRRLLLHSQLFGEGLPVSDYGQYPIAKIFPGINTDFLLTYLTYKFGWILLIGILLVFVAFIVRSVIISKRQKSILSQIVSLAIILTFAIQFLTYIASNLGFLLFGPVSLPLISYGGRALLINMCLIGFLLSIFRTGGLVSDNIGVAGIKSSPLIQYEDGKIIINLKAAQ
ncbi:bacterial cell division membrane protein [Desulfitobacterium dehalogenans ATCC 51507]|uniref:Bacterial cell division membrane protein n=1 Tax=Desulfitobacterium dehalogenans (strain ATCC 51507 / DSM 9161 / JW/IU-DC1) TaxID=756499 RepID=I4A5U3_DESDJ|nr:FtsW/RodA/SpoVE family cell cycle protein [Desulfitobacterium dehalogenans]AFL99327.1 bacterial cell division membrane protein [Desulfitobacterium dehalogenans ATCC 51507]